MRTRRRDEEGPNHERWLVSYADFITLLFAFFVVMYAVSSVNEGKYRVLADSITQAFGNPSRQPPRLVEVNQPGNVVPRRIAPQRPSGEHAQARRQHERMRNVASEITKALGPLLKDGRVRVTQSNRGVAVEINAAVLFEPAQAVLARSSERALQAVGSVLARHDFAIEIEGHTDNVPISTSSFPSNWELSAARASSVVRLLKDAGVAPGRMAAVGLADNRPVDSNATAEGRARNRRVIVMILAAPKSEDPT